MSHTFNLPLDGLREFNLSENRVRKSVYDLSFLQIRCPMSIYTVSENARNELAKVVEWFNTAKVEPRTRSSSICTDKDRFQICGPLLKELGLHEEVH